MAEGKEEISTTEELYFIKPPYKPGSTKNLSEGEWRRVSKQDFAQFDGPAVFGSSEEIRTKIAEAEEVPESCIQDESGWNKPHSEYSVRCSDVEQIQSFLERVKRDGRPANLYYGISSLKNLEKYSGKKISRANEYRNCHLFAIGDEWVLQGTSLRYDPEEAARVIELSKKLPPITKIVRSKIKISGMLGPLWRIIDGKIDKMGYFTDDYPGRRSWYFRRLMRVNSPSTIEQYIWALPTIVEFYKRLTGKKDYRTKEWKKHIKVLLPLLKDHMATSAFRNFIVRETCNR